MSTIDPRIFRAYDIRGKAFTEVTEDACRQIAYAFGQELAKRYQLEYPKIGVGRDARTHSPQFEKAIIEGLLTAGCQVWTLGQIPSPTNYFTVCTQKLDGSIQITASHNHKDDNGLKLQMREAVAFCGEEIQELRKTIEHNPLPANSPPLHPPPMGRVPFDAITPYIKHLTAVFKGVGKGLHVVIDGGNGVAGPAYVQILKNIGCTVTELFIEPDGTFPNHAADPSKWDTLKDLQKTVTESHSDIGLAFDGDGDRLGIVDETGKIRTADETLLLLAHDHLSRHPGSPIVFTVSSSSILESEITQWGGKPVMEKVGHAFVEHSMETHGALLGGEQSGHFFCFENYFHFDDAMVAGLTILKILSGAKSPISILCDQFPRVFQAPESRPHCPDEQKTRIVMSITKHFAKTYPVNSLDGVRIDFGEGAWAGIRQSNTSPCLSVCIEARSPEKLKEVQTIVWAHLRSYPEIEQ
ncbi:phosphomannomutase/phosphoglucomutase [Candidatus Peregrinibacteria bacterium]|nr:phosphomannomutase/phosphoglucomutase [Candidatus Peregrinibacteria bacterium]